MATYTYRCRSHGCFDVVRPVGAAEHPPCPTCGEQPLRVFSPPMIGRMSAQRAAAHACDERSRHEPDVVTSLPPRPRQRPPARAVHPAVRALPRP